MPCKRLALCCRGEKKSALRSAGGEGLHVPAAVWLCSLRFFFSFGVWFNFCAWSCRGGRSCKRPCSRCGRQALGKAAKVSGIGPMSSTTVLGAQRVWGPLRPCERLDVRTYKQTMRALPPVTGRSRGEWRSLGKGMVGRPMHVRSLGKGSEWNGLGGSMECLATGPFCPRVLAKTHDATPTASRRVGRSNRPPLRPRRASAERGRSRQRSRSAGVPKVSRWRWLHPTYNRETSWHTEEQERAAALQKASPSAEGASSPSSVASTEGEEATEEASKEAASVEAVEPGWAEVVRGGRKAHKPPPLHHRQRGCLRRPPWLRRHPRARPQHSARGRPCQRPRAL